MSDTVDAGEESKVQVEEGVSGEEEVEGGVESGAESDIPNGQEESEGEESEGEEEEEESEEEGEESEEEEGESEEEEEESGSEEDGAADETGSHEGEEEEEGEEHESGDEVEEEEDGALHESDTSSEGIHTDDEGEVDDEEGFQAADGIEAPQVPLDDEEEGEVVEEEGDEEDGIGGEDGGEEDGGGTMELGDEAEMDLPLDGGAAAGVFGGRATLSEGKGEGEGVEEVGEEDLEALAMRKSHVAEEEDRGEPDGALRAIRVGTWGLHDCQWMKGGERECVEKITTLMDSWNVDIAVLTEVPPAYEFSSERYAVKSWSWIPGRSEMSVVVDRDKFVESSSEVPQVLSDVITDFQSPTTHFYPVVLRETGSETEWCVVATHLPKTGDPSVDSIIPLAYMQLTRAARQCGINVILAGNFNRPTTELASRMSFRSPLWKAVRVPSNATERMSHCTFVHGPGGDDDVSVIRQCTQHVVFIKAVDSDFDYEMSEYEDARADVGKVPLELLYKRHFLTLRDLEAQVNEVKSVVDHLPTAIHADASLWDFDKVHAGELIKATAEGSVASWGKKTFTHAAELLRELADAFDEVTPPILDPKDSALVKEGVFVRGGVNPFESLSPNFFMSVVLHRNID